MQQKVEKNNFGDAKIDINTDLDCSKDGVKLRRMDDYWEQILKKERIMVLKIDVQGYEPLVLKGAQAMLEAKPPVFIFMEFSPQRYIDYDFDGAQMVYDMIERGYKARVIGNNGMSLTASNGNIEKLAAAVERDEYTVELVHIESVKQLTSGSLHL
jgi:hypothetical protein